VGFTTPLRGPDSWDVTPALVEVHPNLDIDSLDPAWANDNLSRSVLLNVYEPLMSLKGDSLSELEPQLSEKVPSRENGHPA